MQKSRSLACCWRAPRHARLDEATALLDPAAARRTERALAATVKGRTVIAVVHRLHTARDADRVVVMDAGRITEVGTHHELTASNDAYAALWQVWTDSPRGALTVPGLLGSAVRYRRQVRSRSSSEPTSGLSVK